METKAETRLCVFITALHITKLFAWETRGKETKTEVQCPHKEKAVGAALPAV